MATDRLDWSRPLEWPEGREQSRWNEESPFKQRKWGEALDELAGELRRWNATNITISANVASRSVRGSSDANGVVVRCERRVRRLGVFETIETIGLVFALDTYRYAADNAYAIAMTIKYLRGIERYGSAQMANEAIAGFRALPPSTETGPKHRPWRIVLSVPSGIPRADQLIIAKARWGVLRKEHHPDQGGDRERFEEALGAWSRAMEELSDG